MTRTFFCAFMVFGSLNFISSILILRDLAKAGIKASFFELRWQVHKHLKVYKQTALAHTGQIPWPYYGYWSSFVGMLSCGLLTLSTLSQ